MKKGRLVIMALTVGLMLVSCNEADRLLNRYEKAVKEECNLEKRLDKAHEETRNLEEQLDKLELTDEQEKRLYDIADML